MCVALEWSLVIVGGGRIKEVFITNLLLCFDELFLNKFLSTLRDRSNPSLKPTSGRIPLRVRGCKQYGIRSPKQGWVAGRSIWFAAFFRPAQ